MKKEKTIINFPAYHIGWATLIDWLDPADDNLVGGVSSYYSEMAIAGHGTRLFKWFNLYEWCFSRPNPSRHVWSEQSRSAQGDCREIRSFKNVSAAAERGILTFDSLKISLTQHSHIKIEIYSVSIVTTEDIGLGTFTETSHLSTKIFYRLWFHHDY